MVNENQVEAKAAAEAPAKIAKTVADTVDAVAKESAKTAKRTRAASARRAKRDNAAQKTATKAKSRRNARKTRTAARTVRAAHERIQNVTKNNAFAGFNAVPGLAPFQSVFADANERSQDLVKRSQKVAEELANLARANVEAVVEASRVAAEGARSIGQDAVSSGRDGFEQVAGAIRTLAEAKSPTEYMQLQGDFARASFDRMVAESSRMTETMVKLAGEAFQPLSNRASANAERFNTLVA